MDPNTIHFIISSGLGVIITVISWFLKNVLNRLDLVEHNLQVHQLDDVQKFSTLIEKVDALKHSLEKIENKIDRLAFK